MNKRNLTVLLLIFLLAACSEKEVPTEAPWKGPVLKGAIKLYMLNVDKITLSENDNNNLRFRIGGEYLGPEDNTLFSQYAALFGDTAYNVYAVLAPTRIALTDTISSISIKSKIDYDEKHKAGSLLDDITSISYLSYKKWIEDKYRLCDSAYVTSMPLDDYNKLNGVVLMEPTLNFKFQTGPEQKGRYPLTVIMRTKRQGVIEKDFYYESME